MAGHLGAKTCTQQNLRVVKVDTVDGLIYVKGAVPGTDDSWIKVRDAVRKGWYGKCFPVGATVPFPTWKGPCNLRELVPSAAPSKIDPLTSPKRDRT